MNIYGINLFKTVHENTPWINEDTLTAIWENQNVFNKENCFKLGKFNSERIKGQLKILFFVRNSIISSSELGYSTISFLLEKIILLIQIIQSILFKKYFTKPERLFIKEGLLCVWLVISLFTVECCELY